MFELFSDSDIYHIGEYIYAIVYYSSEEWGIIWVIKKKVNRCLIV